MLSCRDIFAHPIWLVVSNLQLLAESIFLTIPHMVLSSQVHAHLHPEADDHSVLNPQPVVENNKALEKMSLNLTPTATSRIW